MHSSTNPLFLPLSILFLKHAMSCTDWIFNSSPTLLGRKDFFRRSYSDPAILPVAPFPEGTAAGRCQQLPTNKPGKQEGTTTSHRATPRVI